ncbi:hypothetical protein BDBG_02373 [Blastomyces gilchristii SLH14081]|uniref:Uncharacterized protein n=1 Tax=Blastomyces gilchristii (strain SLH14081) TaxID=559298 RepID=A0A179UE13_BLAGS|nr:uncharacterized protein BDBG_02373 [Blastomyces gilchristii SLH14081]OAT06090.1 hypothetical protein BDBG_02373 [Blastomyces gilchristii SLH14081]
MASQSPLAPASISRATISFLLSLYPHTIREFYRAKLIAKSTPKAGPKPGSKQSTAKRTNEGAIEAEVEAFLKLDKLRYESIPATLRDRAGVAAGADTSKDAAKRPSKKVKVSKNDDASPLSGAFLEKDEIVNLMSWKLKHGSHRPALMGMIRSNPDSLVKSTTAIAFSQLQGALSNTGGEAFPSTPLETLTGPLRGVGPATASLFLSICPCHAPSDATYNTSINAAPFFSDELFNWLCLDKYPHDFPNSSNNNGGGGEGGQRSKGKSPATKETKIKYNMKEYRELWEAVRELRGRINQIPDQKEGLGEGRGNGEGGNESFSVLDIERVAFVIGHLGVSGYDERMEEASTMGLLDGGKVDDDLGAAETKDVNLGRGKRKRG